MTTGPLASFGGYNRAGTLTQSDSGDPIPGSQWGATWHRYDDLVDAADRGLNHNFEGVFIDDFIIGFAERGEQVSDANEATINFVNNPYYEALTDIDPLTGVTIPRDEVDFGEYQLEARLSADYGGALPSPVDTNAPFEALVALQMVSSIDGRPITGGNIPDGQTVTLSDGENVPRSSSMTCQSVGDQRCYQREHSRQLYRDHDQR